MAGQVGTFDFNRESLNVGTFIITGFADVDDAITPSRRNDMWDLISGADGDKIFIRKSDTSGVITVKLLASSVGNEILADIALAQELVTGVPVAVLYSDASNFPLAAADKAVITKIPDFSRGKNLGSVDWAILCADLTIYPRRIT